MTRKLGRSALNLRRMPSFNEAASVMTRKYTDRLYRMIESSTLQ